MILTNKFWFSISIFQFSLWHSPKKDMAEFNLAFGSFLEIREKRSGSGSSKYTKFCSSLYNILYKIYDTVPT
jgi:hypothetical protein